MWCPQRYQAWNDAWSDRTAQGSVYLCWCSAARPRLCSAIGRHFGKAPTQKCTEARRALTSDAR